MKRKIHWMHQPPLTAAKLASQLGFIASSSEIFEIFVKDLARSEPDGDVLKDSMRAEARRILSTTGWDQLLCAFRLGQLRDQHDLIREEVKTNKGKGSKSTNKPWAEALALTIVGGNPEKTAEQLWRLIPDHDCEDKYCGYEVCREENGLRAHDRDGQVQKLAKISFTTRYISRARKVLKSRQEPPPSGFPKG